jgi:prolyl oligopeptidase
MMTRLYTRLAILGYLTIHVTGCGSSTTDASVPPHVPQDEESSTMAPAEDPYLWLEEVEGERALAWVRTENERSTQRLEGHPLFEAIRAKNLEILTSDARIPVPGLRGGVVYNFWRDDQHVRGLWRRTSRESYRADTPDWEILLDLDALAEAEDENWVWGGATCRHPDYDRCLVSLSIGGADARVVREFDLATRAFVDGGFELPESKSRVAWRDRDSVLLAPAFSYDEMTDSGYPRTVRLWKRGTPPGESELLYEGERQDVSVSASRIWDGDDPYDIISRAPEFFTREYRLYRDGEPPQRLALPDDADLVTILGGRALIRLRSAWELDGARIPEGSLAAATVDELLGDAPRPEVVFSPGPREAIAGISTTESTVLVHVLDNVVSRLLRFTRTGEGWQSHTLATPGLGTLSVVATDDGSDQFYYQHTSFLSPTQLFEADAAADDHRPLRADPAFFDVEGMKAEQREATSADGTRIPYFVVKPASYEEGTSYPTLLSAYGGFQVARTPFYSGVLGASWLERGGVYVLANIRGGGEFGPAWHQAARRENRQRAFDDFIAVAEDLIEHGITTPEKLGIQGGSNGGLLVGAVLVQRPELFNAVVSQVPLLDMRRYHLLLAGASWMAEYGNPDDPDDWAFIGAYSPYQNVSPDADYPQVLVTTSTRDDRVHPGHARKMVARLLEHDHDVLYYENMEGGHGGAANLRQTAYVTALIYTYLHKRLGDAPTDDERSEDDR